MLHPAGPHQSSLDYNYHHLMLEKDREISRLRAEVDIVKQNQISNLQRQVDQQEKIIRDYMGQMATMNERLNQSFHMQQEMSLNLTNLCNQSMLNTS